MRKKTHEEYVLELSNKNPNIEVVGIYIGANDNILHKCKICGHEWAPKPSLVLLGFGCPKCNHKKMTKHHDQYVREVCDKNTNLTVLGEYINYHTKIDHKCNICGYEWSVQPADVLKGEGCPRCAKHIKLTQDEFINRIKEIHPTLQVLGEYEGSAYSVKVKCLKDGYVWEPIASNLMHHGRGCPNCNKSHGESQIEVYLKKYNINFIPQYTFGDCKNKKPLPFDFYLPEYNMCIEYDGIQHFEPVDFFGGYEEFKKCQYNDSIKTEYCINNDIKLLRIRYDQDIIEILDEFFMQQYKII